MGGVAGGPGHRGAGRVGQAVLTVSHVVSWVHATPHVSQLPCCPGAVRAPAPLCGPWPCLLAGLEDRAAAVPHCSPLFCFAPPPHGLLSSSRACMQSVSERAALLVRPERALPPACINSLSWPGRVLANPLPPVGGSWHTGGGGPGGTEGDLDPGGSRSSFWGWGCPSLCGVAWPCLAGLGLGHLAALPSNPHGLLSSPC